MSQTQLKMLNVAVFATYGMPNSWFGHHCVVQKG